MQKRHPFSRSLELARKWLFRRGMGRKSILVVDDEELFRESLSDALASGLEGVVVTSAANGQEALEHIKREVFHLIITDLKMPVLDGFGLLAELHARQAEAPVIVVTSLGDSRTRDQVFGKGALACFEKPVDVDALVQRAHELLEQSAGAIQGVTLVGFAQLLGSERKTCRLHVAAPTESGDLFFEKGDVVHAESHRDTGLKAALSLLQTEDGVFGVHPGVALPERTIHLPLTELIFRSAKIQDEVGRAKVAATENPLSIMDGILIEEVFEDVQQHEVLLEELGAEEMTMADVAASMKKCMEIPGALAAALVDYESGFSLGQAGGAGIMDLEVAAAGNTDVVRAKMRVMSQLGLDDHIDDILITLQRQFHIIRPMQKYQNLFLYLVIDRAQGNLAMARHQVKQVEAALRV